MPSYRHSPEGNAAYTINWSHDLETGETISVSEWDVPAELTEEGNSKDSTNTITTVQLSGGTPGETYRVRNKITTSAGNVYEQTLFLDCERT